MGREFFPLASAWGANYPPSLIRVEDFPAGNRGTGLHCILSRESSSRRLAAPLPDVARLHGPRPPISPGRFDAVLATVAISAAATNLASLPISFSPSPTQEASCRRLPRRERITSTTRRNGAPRRVG